MHDLPGVQVAPDMVLIVVAYDWQREGWWWDKVVSMYNYTILEEIVTPEPAASMFIYNIRGFFCAYGYSHQSKITYPSLDQYNWPCAWLPIPESHHILN